ncbi:MAG: hypothetical protein QXX12_04410 [Nanopusillaceae archaeon]
MITKSLRALTKSYNLVEYYVTSPKNKIGYDKKGPSRVDRINKTRGGKRGLDRLGIYQDLHYKALGDKTVRRQVV